MPTLFEDEKIITESNGKSVVLTNKRIWKEDISGGKSFYQSIALKHITSVQCLSEEFFLLLVVGIMCAGVAIYLGISGQTNKVLYAGIASLIFILLYFLTKGSTVVIASSSTKLKLSIKGMKKDKVMQFINQVEHAITLYS